MILIHEDITQRGLYNVRRAWQGSLNAGRTIMLQQSLTQLYGIETRAFNKRSNERVGLRLKRHYCIAFNLLAP